MFLSACPWVFFLYKFLAPHIHQACCPWHLLPCSLAAAVYYYITNHLKTSWVKITRIWYFLFCRLAGLSWVVLQLVIPEVTHGSVSLCNSAFTATLGYITTAKKPRIDCTWNVQNRQIYGDRK